MLKIFVLLMTLILPISQALHSSQIIRAKAEFFRQIEYYPSPGQIEIHTSEARFKVLCAGARYGKSMVGGAEAAFTSLIPDFRTWIVSSVYELAEKEFTHAIEFLARYKLPNGKSVLDLGRLSSASRGSRMLIFPWGAFIKTKSTEKPQTLLGEELNRIILGEASQIPRKPWERMLRARIGPRSGDVFALSTGNADSNLFADMLSWGFSDDKKYQDWQSWQYKTKDNPTFSLVEYETARRELDPKVFAEQYEGEIISRSGRVFPTFSKGHIFTEFPADFPNWPILRTVYHERNAFNNPFICLFIAVNPTKRFDFWVYGEYYGTQVLPESAIAKIKKRVLGKRLLTTLTDYWNPTLQRTLKENHVYPKVNNEKKYSNRHATVRKIQLLQSALRNKGDGPTIHISANCENFIMEMERAKWPEPKKEEAEMAEQEMPRTKNFGGPMALSNVIAWMRLSSGFEVYEAQGLKRRRA